MNQPTHAYRHRYREPLSSETVPWNETLQLLLNHRTVRAFDRKPVPAGTLEMLISAASSASTSSNKQFWSVVAVDDPDLRKQLFDLGRGRQILEAPILLMWLADLSRISRIAKEKDTEIGGIEYMESFLVAALDATLAAQNAAIAAESMGLGVCFLGVMRNRPIEVARVLKLPDRCAVVFGMCIGYADETVPTSIKPRLPQEVVLHRNQYDATQHSERIDRYDGHARDFRREQGQSDIFWTEHIMGRVANAGALKGREKLGQALQTLGFELK